MKAHLAPGVRVAAIVAAFVLAVAAPAPAQTAPEALRISELLPDPGGGREFIELWNPGDTPVALEGWVVEDAAANSFAFPAWNLTPGARVVVWGGGAGDAVGPAWSKAAVWNNGGDQALLRDPSGAVVDSFAYGDHADAQMPAPGPGVSLYLDETWHEGDPTPGAPPAASGGTLEATVVDVPPTIDGLEAPSTVRTGAPLSVGFTLEEPNGDDVAWTLSSASGEHAAGTGAGTHTVELTAPQAAMTWRLTLQAQDPAGNAAEETLDIRVVAGGLDVRPSPDGVRFTDMAPGGVDVQAEGHVVITNLDEEPVTPVLDVSDFQGPDGAVLPVVGHLEWALVEEGAQADGWRAYEGAATPLDAVPAGASMHLHLRIAQIPAPLPAGAYGTSFAVTA